MLKETRMLHDYALIYEVPSVLNNNCAPGPWGLRVKELEEYTDEWEVYRCHDSAKGSRYVEIKVYRYKMATDGENLRLGYIYDDLDCITPDDYARASTFVFEVLSGDYEEATNPYPVLPRNEDGLVMCEDLGYLVTPEGGIQYLEPEIRKTDNETETGQVAHRYEIFTDEDTGEQVAIRDWATGNLFYKTTENKPATKICHPDKGPDAAERKGLDAVAGMRDLKEQLRKEVLFPLQNKELMQRYRIHPLNGMLLYGPPGCGKSYIAEKFAEESGMEFEKVSSGNLSGQYCHETANAIQEMFKRARSKSPCILCIEEIDALCPHRCTDGKGEGSKDWNESVNEFLTQMNNCSRDGVFVIASTNNPLAIDTALLRTGRLDKIVYVPMPDEECRREMFELHLKDRPQDECIDTCLLAKLTDGMTASDIEAMVNAVAMEAAWKQVNISYEMLSVQAKTQRRSVDKADLNKYPKAFGKDETKGKPSPIMGFTTRIA